MPEEKKTCSVEGCDRPVKHRDICLTHYNREYYRKHRAKQAAAAAAKQSNADETAAALLAVPERTPAAAKKMRRKRAASVTALPVPPAPAGLPPVQQLPSEYLGLCVLEVKRRMDLLQNTLKQMAGGAA